MQKTFFNKIKDLKFMIIKKGLGGAISLGIDKSDGDKLP